MSETTPEYVAQAADVIREFIVEAVGFDHGELMTVQAESLARNLAAAGLIRRGGDGDGDVLGTGM